MSVELLPFPVVSIPDDAGKAVFAKIEDVFAPAERKLSAFRDALRVQAVHDEARAILGEYLGAVRTHVTTEGGPGAAAVDIVDCLGNPSDSSLLRTFVLTLFMSIGGPLAIDAVNRIPFTVNAASAAIQRDMAQSGISHFSPETVLGFHNDGAYERDRLILPRMIGLQNVAINYRTPGRFYWIPLTKWHDGRDLADMLRDAWRRST